MSGTLSKRQQARNEASLQELVHSVAGNDHCADCHARNPAWASWSLGVFLCMRCAAIHRKLGTHISKVKSLSMDAWSNEQVDNMRKVGNLTSNKIYNPENKKPPVPIDADEADSAMERFIRQKYMNNVAPHSGKLKKPQLDEGTPPPLPPKNSKFGFRSASSIFPLSSRAKKEAAKQAATHDLASPTLPPNHMNKQSKVFGATVDYGQDETQKQLDRLRDMGFQDEQRNSIVLKGVNGNLERAVEALVRLGEGERHSPAAAAAPAEKTLRMSRSLTPVGSNSAGASIGLSVQKSPIQDRPTTASTPSTNPFDMMPPAPPMTAHSTGTLQNNNPYLNSTNPFGVPAQQTGLVSQAFQSLSLSPTQPLFPHHTGGVTTQQSHQLSMYQQMPATPSIPQQYQSMGFQTSMTYPQHVAQPLLPQQTGYNPFFSQPSTPFQPQSPQQHLSLNTGQGQAAYANNPFTRSPTRIASPPLTQIPEQSQPVAFQNPLPLRPQSPGTNPFLNNTMQYPVHMAQQPQPFGHQQYYQPQRPDKAAILALYNQPQAPRQPFTPSDPSLPTQISTIPEDKPALMQAIRTGPVSAQQSRSVSQPITSSTNPFMKSGAMPPTSDAFATDRKISRESVNLGMDMAWTNGRHSPDAFASLSARHV